MKGSCIRSPCRLAKTPDEVRRCVRDKSSADLHSSCCSYHRFNFLVKEGYLVLARASTGGRYLGRTCCVKMSGRMITKDRPCGSHDTISESEDSLKISSSFCGKMSRFLESFDSDFFMRLSSSSLTIAGLAITIQLESTSAVRAVAASTR